MKKENFLKFVSKKKSPLLSQLEWESKNELWLEESAKIAMIILDELEKREWSQTDLAFKLNVSPAYVSKLVKGSENLTLETLCKIQNILGIRLLMNHNLSSEVQTYLKHISLQKFTTQFIMTKSSVASYMGFSSAFESQNNSNVEEPKGEYADDGLENCKHDDCNCLIA